MADDLLTIPSELLIKILSNLDAVSLTRCTMACKSIYETFKSSSLLTYIVQLHFNGVCNPIHPASQSYSELLEHLLQRRQAEMFPKWIIDTSLQMRCPCISLDLAGTIFLSTDTENLEIALLPTTGNVSEPTGVFSKSLKPISANNIAIDMTQNLIVLTENDDIAPSSTDTRIIHIQIRTITGTPHRLAQQSHLQFTIEPDMSGNTADNSFLQIARNNLMLYFSTDRDFGQSQPRVLIWDWITSDLLLDSATSSPPLLPSFHSEIALLDSTYFFVTCVDNSGSIQLYKLSRSLASNASAIHLATLHLPPIAPDFQVERIASHAGPIEIISLPHTPFAASDDDRLHVFAIQYLQYDSERHVRQSKHLNLFVHQRVLTKYCMQRARDQDLPLDIPWAVWGPLNTKIIYPSRIHVEYSGQRTTYGQRVVLRGRVQSDERRWYNRRDTNSVEVLDFSLAAVLSARGILPMPQPSSETKFTGKLLSSSKINTSECPIFKDDVETHLPCVSFTADLERTYSRFLIYADGVIGLNFGPHMCNACLDVYTI